MDWKHKVNSNDGVGSPGFLPTFQALCGLEVSWETAIFHKENSHFVTCPGCLARLLYEDLLNLAEKKDEAVSTLG